MARRAGESIHFSDWEGEAKVRQNVNFFGALCAQIRNINFCASAAEAIQVVFDRYIYYYSSG